MPFIKIRQKNPRALGDLARKYLKTNDYVCAVGYPVELVDEVRYPGKVGKKGKKSKGFSTEAMRVTDVAYINEKGSKSQKIPPRPFMEKSVEPTKRMITREYKRFGIAIKRSHNTKRDVTKDFLNIMGEKATSIHKKTITDLKEPGNAQSTIARKGSDNPLIDTSLMRNTLTYVVRKRKKES